MARRRRAEEWSPISVARHGRSCRALREKSVRQYPFSQGWTGRDVMECMYLGDLRTLIVHSAAWAMFKPVFDDKSKLEILLSSISHVPANDRAHFASVPRQGNTSL